MGRCLQVDAPNAPDEGAGTVISLLSILRRFVAVIRQGWSEPEFRGLSIVLAGWITLGTIIYAIYEKWTLIESFYFSVMTLTTIGYGDYAPSTPTMQLYTVFYSVLGIGFFVAFNAKLVQIALARRWQQSTPDDAPSDD